MSSIPAVTLNNGKPMPQVGFGVFQVPDAETDDVVATALETGYRSIDTAALYKNEEGTGRAIAASALPREELFITTKLGNTDHGYDAALRAFDTSLAKLGLDYVDLYLIHWPAPAQNAYVDTWRAFERIHSEGRAKAIGVSNFQPSQLQRLMDETGTVPAVNQIELHPRLQQATLREFHAANGIVTEAWSPLGKGKWLLDAPTLAKVAERHGVSPGQVALRWSTQLGNVVIPKSATPSRIRDNLDLFGFELDSEDMSALASMDTGERVGPAPDALS